MTSNGSALETRRGSPWRLAGWGTAIALLLFPAIAMQFSDEVNWGVEDFAFATIMIGGVGLVIELTVRLTSSLAHRAGVAIMLAVIFVTCWVNLAVGIIGNEDNPKNLMFFTILLVPVFGSMLVRFRSRGMAWVMLASAAAQIAVGVIGLAMEFFVPVWTAVMTFAWLSAAMLFFKAAKEADFAD